MRLINLACTLGTLLAAASATSAEIIGTLTYAPPSEVSVPIPMLLLLPMGVALAVLGGRAIRRQGARSLLGMLLLVGGLVTLATSGLHIRQATALPTIVQLDNPAGGTVPIPTTAQDYQNTSGVALRIFRVDHPETCTSNAANACVAGLILEDGDICSTAYINECNKRIFVTAALYDGDLGGIAGADAKCNDTSDQNNPGDGSTYKAILSGGTRTASPAVDWSLIPDTPYYRASDGVLVATTTNAGVFPFPLDAIISSDGIVTWTGLNADWTPATDCSAWTSGSNSQTGVAGDSTTTSSEAISWSIIVPECNFAQTLYCAEQ